MITDVYVVYDRDEHVKRIEGVFSLEETAPSFHLIDVRSNKTKKDAWSLKNHWAAKLDPFAIVMNGDKAIKAFYSETGEDVIGSLLNYLSNNETTNSR